MEISGMYKQMEFLNIAPKKTEWIVDVPEGKICLARLEPSRAN